VHFLRPSLLPDDELRNVISAINFDTLERLNLEAITAHSTIHAAQPDTPFVVAQWLALEALSNVPRVVGLKQQSLGL
jgi:hypothetical protein